MTRPGPRVWDEGAGLPFNHAREVAGPQTGPYLPLRIQESGADRTGGFPAPPEGTQPRIRRPAPRLPGSKIQANADG